MKSPVILAAMLLAAPAMGGGTTFIEKNTPPTELEICTINLRTMKDLVAQAREQVLAAPAAPAAAVPGVALAKPEAVKPAVAEPKAKAKARACPVLRGKQKCRRGRTQSPKHKCKCGVWS